MYHLRLILEIWFCVYIVAILSTLIINEFQNFTIAWKTTSRILSILNAMILSISAIFIIYTYPDVLYFDEDLATKEPQLAVCVKALNCIFFGYLLFDGMCLMLFQHDNSMSTYVHHFIGAPCMYSFYLNKGLLWNSLYFCSTELSTIFLHLTWFCINYESKLKGLFGVLTWLTFFIVRVIGGSWLIWTVLHHTHEIQASYSVAAYFGYVYGNTTIVSLNFFWFWKLTMSLVSHLRGRKVRTD